MININGKRWEKLRGTDIQKLLTGTEDESFFFEFKSDLESNDKLIKEVSALSNTYGGYIFLGINDDKTIGGCIKWTEQRIHNVMHNLITPTPIFDVRRFAIRGEKVLVIRIEEGPMPPYVTNNGDIYERVSSGSFKVKDSAKLTQLYNKRKDQLKRLHNKIELPPISVDVTHPTNICGCVDLGFEIVCSQATPLQKDFFHFDLQPVAEYLRDKTAQFNVTRVGRSVLVSVGNFTATDDRGNPRPVYPGMHNFLEIMADGSIRCRVVLTKDLGTNTTSISNIPYMIHELFQHIYRMVMGDEIIKHFIYAHKYEKLTVVQQFIPDYLFDLCTDGDTFSHYGNLLINHRSKYGNNVILESNRIPKNDYELIDRQRFDTEGVTFSVDTLMNELFTSEHTNLGFIDF